MFAGRVISLGLSALLSAPWVAVAYSDADGSGWIGGKLPWFLGGTAIAAPFRAGLVAGFRCGARGPGCDRPDRVGPAVRRLGADRRAAPDGHLENLGTGLSTNQIGGSLGASGGGVSAESAIWTTMWSLLILAVVAALGGVAGDAAEHDAKIAGTDVRGERDAYPVRAGRAGGDRPRP